MTEAVTRYIGIVVTIIVFVVLYVWQNIEVMKMKMEYRRGVRIEKQLVKENDRLHYEIERMRRLDRIEKYAQGAGLRYLGPQDFDVITVKQKGK
ncbi:MAG: hypothetical protein EPN93_09660 [Spirochaetes bacterium]|nr:MAG: hypothetical protein EPN93_09660 [Spirochaetota bacterium]